MNYGFVIDNRKCIGCHACSTACKSENQVPLGVNRTWVKYTETGQATPTPRRHFQVTRCNHCANPPCARASAPSPPCTSATTASWSSTADVCIGCKACTQACPYDAIYIDPDSGTAAKCHFCAHRVDERPGARLRDRLPRARHPRRGPRRPEQRRSARALANECGDGPQAPSRARPPSCSTSQGSEVASMHPSATSSSWTPSFLWAEVLPLHGDQAASLR